MPTPSKNRLSHVVNVRIPIPMLEELKRLSDDLGCPYQQVLKEAITWGLPLVRKFGIETKSHILSTTRSYRAPNVDAALRKLQGIR
jgi:hypothetical protein